MRHTEIKRNLIIVLATLLAGSILALAQNTQPQQKESLWQKLKSSAKQTGQNTVQQGSQQVQQGAQQVQQNVQQQIPGGGGQMNAAPQSPCGSLTGANGGGNLNNASNNGAGGSCGPQCFNAGPFAAAVTQMTMSQQGGWHVIRMNIQFKNLSDQPLIIAYRDGSMVMVDNNGNTYIPAGGYPGAVQGIGIDRGGQTDSQFTLGPGQTGNAMFAVARGRSNQSAVGTGYAYNFTIDELQAQNGAEAIPVRQYNLNFPDLAPGATSAGFGGPGSSPTGAPVTNVAGSGASRGGAVPGSSYVGGATPAAGGVPVNGAPAQGAVAGASPAGIAPNGKGAAIGRTVSTSARPGVASTVRTPVAPAPAASTSAVAPAQRTVNNAALQTNAATVAKPTPAAKPIPTRPAPKKTTTTTTSTTAATK